jgi:hypothetical protein
VALLAMQDSAPVLIRIPSMSVASAKTGRLQVRPLVETRARFL